MDFSKVFDSVPHNRLLLKLNQYGITGNIHAWLTKFLTCRRQRVVLGGASSSWNTVISGVPQGTVIGPLMFLIYLNDLPEGISSPIRLFADDCVIYRNISSKSDVNSLQKDLKVLDKWQQSWQMSFNAAKCFLLRITHKKTPLDAEYTLGNSVLQQIKSHSYLGVEINQDLKWDTHINRITAKANRSLGFIRRNLASCPQNLKAQAYTTLVRPLLEYSSTVWDTNTENLIKQIESVQRRAARFTMRDYSRYSSPTDMMTKLKWEPLKQRRKIARVTMIHKIVNGQAAIPEQKFLQPVKRSSNRNQHTKRFTRPNGKKDCWVDSFFPSTIPVWNKLPQYIVDIKETQAFKKETTTHFNNTPQAK